MVDTTVVALRLMQYLGAMILFGSSLFFLYALPRAGPAAAVRQPWIRNLLLAAALVLIAGSLLQIGVQSVSLSESVEEGLKLETIRSVVTFMPQAKAGLLQAAVAVLAALALLARSPRRSRLVVCAALGGIATISLAWMGHAAATEGSWGSVHRVSDVLHVLAGGIWIGALFGFLGLLIRRPQESEEQVALHAALEGFSGVGSMVVAALVLTGIVNTWVLVGIDNLGALWTSPYGRLLSLKVSIFIAMCVLAAANRYRLTPAFGRSLEGARSADTRTLRRSLYFETALGVTVLALVAWFGTLAPPVGM